MRRREFLSYSACSSLILAGGPVVSSAANAASRQSLDSFFEGAMSVHHVPGAAAVIVNREGVLWSNAFGWADMEQKRPMTLDSIQNIGSISKTFVATAIMQLKEKGLLDLDTDINDYLGFSIRNPKHRSKPITARHLLTHTSSLRDGSAYVENYACGDPRFSLDPWVRAFFLPNGVYYDAEENFEKWGPGEKRAYTNVSWGVLGLVVERISGIEFPVYCRRNIFAHLRMHSTNWMLADIDQERHSTPYSWIESGENTGGVWGGVPLGVVRPDGPTLDRELEGGFHRNCLYNHPNYPDGFLRTTVNDLAKYLLTYLNKGVYLGRRILTAETVGEMLTHDSAPVPELDGELQGICWYSYQELGGERQWGHEGGDPGVSTELAMLPRSGLGAIVFTNSYSDITRGLIKRMLEKAYEL